MDRLDVNTASAEELALVAGLNDALAARLVALRTERPFRDGRDLASRLGIAPPLVSLAERQLRFGDDVAASPADADELRLRWVIRQEVTGVLAKLALALAPALQAAAARQLGQMAFFAGADQDELLATWQKFLTEKATRVQVRDYITLLIEVVTRWQAKSEARLGKVNLSVILLAAVLKDLDRAEIQPAGGEGSAERKHVVKLIVHALSRLGMLKDLAIVRFIVGNAAVALPASYFSQVLAALKLIWSGRAGLAKIAEVEEAIERLDPEAARKALDELEELDPDETE